MTFLNELPLPVDRPDMRANRCVWAGILAILAAGVPNEDQAFSAGDAGELHPHQAESCATCHLREAAVDEATHWDDLCRTCHDHGSPADASLGAEGPDGLIEMRVVALFSNPGDGAAGSDDASASAESGSGLLASASSTRDDGGSRCTRCHSFHNPTRITLVDREIDITDPKIADHCNSCHSHSDATKLARLTEGHRAAAALYHSMGGDLAAYSPSDACLLCHDQANGTPANLPVALPVAPRFDSHASHPYGIRMAGTGDFFRPVIDPRIQLLDGRIECQTCHDLSAQSEDLLVVFETPYEMCRGCHTQGLPQGQFQDGLVQR